MINTTTEFKQAMEQNNVCASKATILLKNGTLLDIPNSKISQGGIKIEDATSSTSSFDIGSAIINKLTISLNNMYDEFSDYDFTDAVVTVWVGKQLSDRMEWLKKGVFNTDDPTATPSILTLEALDNMSKFDVVYDGNLTFPATLQTIVQYCCGRCGVTMISGQFPNYNYSVAKNPFDDNSNITYRAILSYCAQIAGCYARCNADGNLELKWYDTAAFDGIIDGGMFDKTTEPSYQTGDDLDGGNFTDYSSGDTADGGNFTDPLPYHHIYSLASLSVSTEDVMITGIRVTAADSESSDGKKLEGETYLCGVEGYILHIKGNPLIEYGRAQEAAEYLGGRIIGMRFRPFTASCLGDPSMEAGDAAVVTDRKGNSYYTYLTNISYSTGNYASISCDAEPAARHSADRYSEIEKIVAEIKKDSQFQLSEYAQYVDKLNTLAINAMGYYETTEIQDDGSMIKYMHDKPLLSESTIVYKNSIDGFFWSKDGGQTYTAGVDKNGNAVMNVIAAIGISFDWASGGTLTLGGKDNVNGILSILRADGRQAGKWDKDGLDVSGLIHITGGGSIGRWNFNSDGTLTAERTNAGITYRTTIAPAYRTADTTIDVLTVEEISSGNTKKMMIDNTGDVTYMVIDSSGNENRLFNLSISDISCQLISSALNVWIHQLHLYGNLTSEGANNTFNGNVHVGGKFTVAGSKNRCVKTEHYGEVLLNAYETASPMFGDLGYGKIEASGECNISIDPVFLETIASGYFVFLQSHSENNVYVKEKLYDHFVVCGQPDTEFEWELKAPQKGYEHARLERMIGGK